MYDIKNVFGIEQVFKYVIISIHIEIAVLNLHSNKPIDTMILLEVYLELLILPITVQQLI